MYLIIPFTQGVVKMQQEAPVVDRNPQELWPRSDFDIAAAPLVAILQIAIEAAVLPNKFEIDEQTPHSRLEALLEQAQAEVGRYSLLESETERTSEIIKAVAERVRLSIRLLDSHDLRDERARLR